MYVLPNILHSHIELCIINRLMNLYYGAPMGEVRKHHPFPIIDYSARIDHALAPIVKRLSSTKMLYFSVLKNIPSIADIDAQSFLMMPDIAKTRQVWWAMILSRLRIIVWLIDIGGVAGIAMNRSMIAKLQIDLKRLIDENIIRTMVPKDMYFDIDTTIHDILRL
jgi:hypothetical protein